MGFSFIEILYSDNSQYAKTKKTKNKKKWKYSTDKQL